MKWQSHRLDGLGIVARGRSRHRPRDAEHLYGGPYPFIQTGDVKQAGLYITNHSQTYSEAGLEQSKLWPAGTLCITIAANIADTAILAFDACFPDSVIGFRADNKKADARFVKYLFDVTIQQQARQFSQGATQDNLSQEKLLSIEFLVPNINVQGQIADVLSAYDHLIDNNRRRIKLLEESVRLLFDEWFIRQRLPAHLESRDEAEPQRLAVADLCVEMKAQVLPEALDADTPYIGLEHMPRRSITLSEWGAATEVTSPKLRYVAGDIIFGKIRPYFHKVGFAITDGVCSSDAIVMRPRRESWRFLLLALVSSDLFIAATAQGMKEGSKMPRADWKQMMAYSVCVPSPQALDSFNATVEPVLQQVKTLALQSCKLRSARDLLLPRLMSGELTV